MVTINELILGVNIGLGGLTLDLCERFDRNGDGVVMINEVVGAVNEGLFGCGRLELESLML